MMLPLTYEPESVSAPDGGGPLAGKSAVCFGDSITWYDGHVYNWGKEEGKTAVGYESYLRLAGMTVQNEGISGASIREIREHILETDLRGFDYVLITSGANDSRVGLPTGELRPKAGPFDTGSFFGCLQSAVEHVLAVNGTARIILMTPIRGWIYAPEGYACRRTEDGEVEERFAEAIQAVGMCYGCTVCDWYHESGIEKETMSLYINDPDPDRSAAHNPNALYSLHPSSAGFARMAKLLLSCMKEE